MKNFESGVKFYTSGKATVKINFPENEVKCHWCPFCRAEEALKRHWCRLTNDIIYNPESGLGDNCPIIFEKE